jgi:hypothetical protein
LLVDTFTTHFRFSRAHDAMISFSSVAVATCTTEVLVDASTEDVVARAATTPTRARENVNVERRPRARSARGARAAATTRDDDDDARRDRAAGAET